MKSSAQFELTREDVLELAAQKVADEYCNEESVSELVHKKINERVEAEVQKLLVKKVDDIISAETDRLMRSPISPVNVWGEQVGKPTTIRDAMATKAKEFWNENVGEDGKPTSYRGTPRHIVVFRQVANEEFVKAVQQNIVNLVGAFKDALREDAKTKVDGILNDLLKVKSPSEQKH